MSITLLILEELKSVESEVHVTMLPMFTESSVFEYFALSEPTISRHRKEDLERLTRGNGWCRHGGDREHN